MIERAGLSLKRRIARIFTSDRHKPGEVEQKNLDFIVSNFEIPDIKKINQGLSDLNASATDYYFTSVQEVDGRNRLLSTTYRNLPELPPSIFLGTNKHVLCQIRYAETVDNLEWELVRDTDLLSVLIKNRTTNTYYLIGTDTDSAKNWLAVSSLYANIFSDKRENPFDIFKDKLVIG